MFEFIKSLFKPQTFKEIKKEYRQAKANYIAKVEVVEGLEKEYKADKIVDDIVRNCCIRYGQTGCPVWIICCYKKLLELGDEKSLYDAKNYLHAFLPRPVFEDFENQVSQLKEYKEWLTNKKMKAIEKDFE